MIDLCSLVHDTGYCGRGALEPRNQRGETDTDDEEVQYESVWPDNVPMKFGHVRRQTPFDISKNTAS